MSELIDMPLLSTKLKIPVPRRDYVVRSALFEKLSACHDMSVIFVCGGAGTGKTTLLSSFVKEKKLKKVGWLSLDSSNANVYSFWYYFVAAAGAFLGEDNEFLSFMCSNFDLSRMENLLTMLINRLCSEEDYYMVLDDMHCIRDEALMRTLEFFISAMPDNLHLFMLSREDPPVYLGSLAVSGRLLYIDGRQMKLSSEESIVFLRQTLKLQQCEDELNRLNTYAEGWIGGLQLAAAAENAGKNSGALLQAGGGIAAEYLTREIYESLTREEQNFLLATGYLSYFDSQICQHLFDGFVQSVFEEMIEKLIQKNLFLICIDEQNEIFRYHNILSEYLTRQFSRLPEKQRAEWINRAVTAFEQHGDKEEVLRLLCEAGDYKRLMSAAHKMGGSVEAWYYLDKIPLDILVEDADLSAQCFIYNFGSLNLERCSDLYEKFKVRYEGTNVLNIMQFAESYLSLSSGSLPEYRTLTSQQIDSLNIGSVAKAMLLIENSNALVDRMEYEEAQDCINRSIKLCSGVNAFIDAYAQGQRAQLLEEIGGLNESLLCYDQATKLLSSPFMKAAMGISFYVGLTGVHMRRMELEKAEEALNCAVGLMKNQHARVNVLSMELDFHAAEMKLLRGDVKEAEAFVKNISVMCPEGNSLNVVRLLQELECEEGLGIELTDQFMRDVDAAEHYRSQPFIRLLHARILFRQGNKEAALQETEEVLLFARKNKNRLRLVESDLLKVYILSKLPQSPDYQRLMNNLVREAVYYAYENKIIQPFYLDRHTVLPLLLELRNNAKSGLNTAESEFLREAIALCGASAGGKEPDLLSSRELDVLTELAQGITNREIADKLCISQATVKTHVLNIFGKLGVSTRLLAVEEGRKRGFIGR